ncbi:MAG TPA: aminotransferase class V-fold PLP-dependent enzyme, partial [Chryseolinea sp.]|nr:aminotransferase class V-fold PLP-dependent enzyme [Chryseolinea sp.]
MTTNNFSTDEILQIRKDTSGTAYRIHFNNAGSSLPPDIVVQTVTNYLQQEALEGGYEMENNRREELANVYTLIARLINATPGEIAITENASAAWGMAFNGIEFGEGDVILASEYEYVTNILGLLRAGNKRVAVRVIPNNEEGDFSIRTLEEMISPKTKLIAVTHVSSSA